MCVCVCVSPVVAIGLKLKEIVNLPAAPFLPVPLIQSDTCSAALR